MVQLAAKIPSDRIDIEVDTWSRPFWEAAKDGRLVASQCVACGAFRMPPYPFCPKCHSQDTHWPTLPGTGTVYSFVICHRSPYPGVPDFTFVPIVVEPDEAPGVRLISNIVDIQPEAVSIGMRVRVDFQPVNGGWKTPIFRAADPQDRG